MKKIVLLILLALTWPVWATIPPEADRSATLGDYEKADQIYIQALAQCQDPTERRKLVCRRLAVAQARFHLAAARSLDRELEDLLAKQDDPEVAMRLYLIRGALAFRCGDFAGAGRAYAQARPLAERLGSPGAALGRYECASFDYFAKIGRQGRPTPEDYVKAALEADKLGKQALPTPDRRYWPLDVTRSLVWTREWIWQAWEYSYLFQRRGEPLPQEAWGKVFGAIANNAAANLQKLGESLQDLELGLGAMHAALEGIEGFPQGVSPEQFAAIYKFLQSLPDTQEVLCLRGRYWKARARWSSLVPKDWTQTLADYAQSAEHFRRAQRPTDLVDALVETSYRLCLDQGPREWVAPVEKNLQEALQITSSLSYPLGRYYSLGFAGTMKARGGDWAGAEVLLRQSLDQMESWMLDATPVARQQALARPEAHLFAETLIEAVLKQGRQVDALELAQKMSATSEVAGLDLSRVKGRTPEVSRALEEVRQKRDQGTQLRAQLQSAQMQGDQGAAKRLDSLLADNKAAFHRALNQLQAQDPDFGRLLQVRPSSFSKIQAQLPPEVVLVEYLPATDRLYLFAVTRSDLRIHTVPLTRDGLEKQIRELRRHLVDGSTTLDGRSAELLSNLYQALIGPLEPLLANRQVLLVIPSRSLYCLPFAALRGADGKFLAEHKAVTIMTATEVPDMAAYKAAALPNSLLALANPDGTLPGARQEVEQLAPLFPQKSLWFETNATRDRVANADVVHIATHGVLDTGDVNNSYLLLANGRLTASDIYDLKLDKVSLVTLSACQTGIGSLSGSDSELATLAQAFSVAGSKSMVASLWKVSDNATAQLMVEFYRQLMSGKTKAEALRQAQLAVMRQAGWSNPFYWASFELIGDWH